jgi:hypothetical protein
MCELDESIIQKLDDIFKSHSCFDKAKKVAYVKKIHPRPRPNTPKNSAAHNTVERSIVSMMNKMNKNNYTKLQQTLVNTILTPDNQHIVVPFILNSVATNNMYIGLISHLLKSIETDEVKAHLIAFIDSVEKAMSDSDSGSVLKNTDGYANFCTSNKLRSKIVNHVKFCMLLKVDFPEFEPKINHLAATMSHLLLTDCNDILMDIVMQTNIIPHAMLMKMYVDNNWADILSPRIKILLNLFR